MNYYNGAQWCEQFLQVGRLDRPLMLLDVAFYVTSWRTCLLHSLLYLLVSWALWDWLFTWSTYHCDTVGWVRASDLVIYSDIARVISLRIIITYIHNNLYSALRRQYW